VSVGSVLVTGGAGYVGAHTCKALSKAGYLPVVIDNLSTGHASFVRWGPLIEANISDSDAVLAAFRSHRIAAVLHFAASALVEESVTDPQKYYENNVVASLALLGAMRRAGCRKIVFSSSCAVYGEPHESPIREETPKHPVNPYGASKLLIERVLHDYGAAYALESIALRYFNACGADPDCEIGELRDPETHLIPRAMMALQGHLSDFEVFGNDYPTEDGTPIRDYIHVSDLAHAHVASVRRLIDGAPGGAFNLGSGRGYSVKQVLEAINTETGQHLTVGHGPRRKGDPPILVADATRAAEELGFRPLLSDLKTIIATAWAWHSRVHPKRHVADNGDARRAVQT
jgi:UDP-glucose 4-epimerase/UDP-arabinose 4-epimerase